MFECRWKKNEYNYKIDVADEIHIKETQRVNEITEIDCISLNYIDDNKNGKEWSI